MEALVAGGPRSSASKGEREAAHRLARRLRDVGASDVRVQAFRYQRSWAARQAPHFAAGLLAAGVGSRALALATLASFDAEFSGRRQWLAALMPTGEGANVVARVPARGDRRRTLVLVAHVDAAQIGFPWRHPRLTGVQVNRDEVPSFAGGPELGMALVALGGSRARVAGGLLLAVSLASALDVARSETVPGASDNASGVASVLALVERFAAEPLDGVEVVALLPGCEESGMGGMRAWLRSPEGRALDPASTLVLGLDTLGGAEPVVLAAEGPPRRVRYRSSDLALAGRGAERAGLPAPRRFAVGGWTDPALALFAGLPAISVLSATGGALAPGYHLPSDTVERIDWDTVERCTRLAAGVAEELAAS